MNLIDMPEEYVLLSGGKVALGTKYCLPCPVNGLRQNEGPRHFDFVKPFAISKTCVSNLEFEQYHPKHHRSATSADNLSPVTEVTYAEASAYAKWLSQKIGRDFCLPTEIEWTFAASPYGWEYPYKKGPKPVSGKANTFTSGIGKTVVVNDNRFGTNCYGLFHMAGNVCEMTSEVLETAGHNGFDTDGSYCIIKGGDFGHCDYSARVAMRGIFDISHRCTRVGFRLVMHP